MLEIERMVKGMGESNEINDLRRKQDFDNLQKIPVMETNIGYIKETVEKIEYILGDYNTIRTDVKWLKNWHWKIIAGTIGAIGIAVVTIIMGVLKR